MASIWVEDLCGRKYKVRWRELVPGPDGGPVRDADGRLRRRARSKTVKGKEARDEVVARVRRALLEEGEYESPTARVEPMRTNLERAALGWIRWKRTRCKPRSVVSYANHMKRFFELVRELQGIGEDEPVWAEELSQTLVIACVERWQDRGYSEAWVYACGRSVVDMWLWVADDPASWPGVPPAPREKKRVLPRVPVYGAPLAPTLAEEDACLRHISPNAVESRRIGAMLRFTGLRISQVLAVQRKHLDLAAGTLRVVVGKSRQEAAEQRVIPLSRHLLVDVREQAEGLEPDDYLFPAWGARRNRPANVRAVAFHEAWEAATAAGEVRRAVWDPPNRKIARPQQAFRAGFQAYMRGAGVGEEVIDALVGHRGRSVRSRHYAGSDTLEDRMRAAVDGMPPIDWRGPGAGEALPEEENVVLLFPGKGR